MWEKIENFQPYETECRCGCGANNVDEISLEMLDNARNELGRPMILNSVCRCPKHNKVVGGVDSSSHISTEDRSCKAFDIRCNGSRERYEIIEAVMKAGFNRIGIANTFIHVDHDLAKSPNVIWTY